jgi:hypothetical protein
METDNLLSIILSAIIGITGYVLLFIFYGWKLVVCILLIHWCINCERNDYINKIFRKDNK